MFIFIGAFILDLKIFNLAFLSFCIRGYISLISPHKKEHREIMNKINIKVTREVGLGNSVGSIHDQIDSNPHYPFNVYGLDG